MKITHNTNKIAHPMRRPNHLSITSYYAIKKIFKTVFRVMKNQTIGWTLTLKIVKFQTREKPPPRKTKQKLLNHAKLQTRKTKQKLLNHAKLQKAKHPHSLKKTKHTKQNNPKTNKLPKKLKVTLRYMYNSSTYIFSSSKRDNPHLDKFVYASSKRKEKGWENSPFSVSRKN